MTTSTKPGAPVLIVHWTETEHYGEFSDTGPLGGIYHGATTTKHRGIFVAPSKVVQLTTRGDFNGLISTIKPSTITDYRPGVIGADNLAMED